MAKKKLTESCKFKPQSLAKAFALLCGLYLFLAALLPALGFEVLWWNNRALTILAAFYPGLAPTFLGALIGLIWGVVTGALYGLIIAWIYDRFSR